MSVVLPSIDGMNKCPECGGKPSWGYGYAGSVRVMENGHTKAELGSYLMCEECSHVLQFMADGDLGDAQCVETAKEPTCIHEVPWYEWCPKCWPEDGNVLTGNDGANESG